MRFGVFIPQGWRFDLVGIPDADQWGVMRDLAQHADADPGWESVWVYDHFHTTPRHSDEATHEAWSLMAGFAAATSRVRLGQMCTCMSYRNPAYLAKVAATVDHISAGRLEMGIGGGWYEHEWRAYGYGFPEPRERLGRLREGVEIFRQAWTTGESTLNGKYYQVDGAICRPLPVQRTSPRNNIPIWVAGGGEKVTLRIAAKYADYSNYFGDVETFKAKSELLKQHCQDLGRDYDEITRTAIFNVYVAETEAEAQEQYALNRANLAGKLGETAADAYLKRQQGNTVVGSVDQVASKMREIGDAGVQYTIANFAITAYDRTGMDVFAREVIPALA